jgi:hypothetical protein
MAGFSRSLLHRKDMVQRKRSATVLWDQFAHPERDMLSEACSQGCAEMADSYLSR